MTALTGLDWLKTGSFWRLADNPESMQEPDFYDCLTACLVKKVWLEGLGGLKLPTIGRFLPKVGTCIADLFFFTYFCHFFCES